MRGLYTGLTASVFRQMTYSVTRLGVYDVMKNTMSNNGVKKLRTGDMVICASVAGALGGVAGNPADIILVRYVVPRSTKRLLLINRFLVAEWSPTLQNLSITRCITKMLSTASIRW